MAGLPPPLTTHGDSHEHVLRLLLSLVFHCILYILLLHSIKFCFWNVGEGSAGLRSQPSLDFADSSWELSLESPQKLPVFSLPNKSKMGQAFQHSPPVRATRRLWDAFVQMWRKATIWQMNWTKVPPWVDTPTGSRLGHQSLAGSRLSSPWQLDTTTVIFSIPNKRPQ